MLIPMRPQPYQGRMLLFLENSPIPLLGELPLLLTNRGNHWYVCLSQLLFIPLINFVCSKTANPWTHTVHTLLYLVFT